MVCGPAGLYYDKAANEESRPLRPIPARKHHLSIAILLGVATINVLLTYRDRGITDGQANLLAEVIKQGDPTLYAGDAVFGSDGLSAPWRLSPPAWRGVLWAAWRISGSDDPEAAFRLLGTAVLTVYLLLMYMLVYRQTHSTTTGLLIAMMSTAIFSVRRPYWGMGPLFSVTPTAVVIAFTPLIAVLLLRSWWRWWVIGVFALAGLVGNIEPHTAMGLTAVLLVTLLGLRRFRPRAWLAGAAGLAAAAVGAAPTIWHYLAMFRAGGRMQPALTIAELREVLDVAGVQALYPEVLVQALKLLPMVAVLGIPAGIILARAGRYRVRQSAVWLWLLGAVALVAFGLHGLMQLTGRLLGTAPPTLSLFAALRLAMLPLYILLAQAAVHLIRIARTHRGLVRAVLAAYVLAFLASSYNLLPFRHMAQSALANLAGKEPRRTDRGAEAEFRAICRWIQTPQNTPVDTLVVTDQAEVRARAWRPITCAAADMHYLYHFGSGALANWQECVSTQRGVLHPPDRPKAAADRIVRFADAVSSWHGRSSPWPTQAPLGKAVPPTTLVLVEAPSAPDAAGRLVEIPAPPISVPPEQAEICWGLHWRLYRVLPPGPAATAPTTTDALPSDRSSQQRVGKE